MLYSASLPLNCWCKPLLYVKTSRLLSLTNFAELEASDASETLEDCGGDNGIIGCSRSNWNFELGSKLFLNDWEPRTILGEDCFRIGLLRLLSKLTAFLKILGIDSVMHALLRAIGAVVGVGADVLEGSEFGRGCGESREVGDPKVIFSRLRSSLSEIAARPDNSE